VLQHRRANITGGQELVSTTTPGISDPPDAPSAGADLRLARERLGWSISDIAESLHIRVTYLAALEEGRLNLLPGTAYALGFLRTYAKALGLDPEEMVRRFRSETAAVSREPELVFPAPVPEGGLPVGALVLLGLVLVVCAYGGWYRLSGEGRLPAETSLPIPERLAPLAEQAMRTPPPVTPEPAPAPRESAVSTATLASPDAPETPPPAAYAPTSAAASPVMPPATALAPATAPLAPAQTGPDQSRLTIRATADAWILVKDRGGPVLLNRILKAGETWSVPPKPNLVMTTGNAGGTEVLLDGETTASLGGAGAVRRDLPLDPSFVKEGKLAVGALPVSSARPQQ